MNGFVVGEVFRAAVVESNTVNADVLQLSHQLFGQVALKQLNGRFLGGEEEGQIKHIQRLIEAAVLGSGQKYQLNAVHLHTLNHFTGAAELLLRVNIHFDATARDALNLLLNSLAGLMDRGSTAGIVSQLDCHFGVLILELVLPVEGFGVGVDCGLLPQAARVKSIPVNSASVISLFITFRPF